MSRRTPPREYVAPVARYRIRFAKGGRVRFASHRDFQRAFERSLRRAGIPMAYSAGFNPHPRISFANAAPTGAASDAEFVEIQVMQELDCDETRKVLDSTLPSGFEVLDVVRASDNELASRLQASVWQIELPGVPVAEATEAIAKLERTDNVIVERMTKKGLRRLDIKSALSMIGCEADENGYAILQVVVRHGSPAVRPDDVLAGLRQVSALAPPHPAVMTRLAQGLVTEDRQGVSDPLAVDREMRG